MLNTHYLNSLNLNKDLREAFEAFDLNGDGKLSKEEFENVFYVADLNLSKAEKKLIVNKYFLFYIKQYLI